MLIALPNETLYCVVQALLEINAALILLVKPKGHLLWPITSESHALAPGYDLHPDFILHPSHLT